MNDQAKLVKNVSMGLSIVLAVVGMCKGTSPLRYLINYFG